jgi:hypothetical protein
MLTAGIVLNAILRQKSGNNCVTMSGQWLGSVVLVTGSGQFSLWTLIKSSFSVPLPFILIPTGPGSGASP